MTFYAAFMEELEKLGFVPRFKAKIRSRQDLQRFRQQLRRGRAEPALVEGAPAPAPASKPVLEGEAKQVKPPFKERAKAFGKKYGIPAAAVATGLGVGGIAGHMIGRKGGVAEQPAEETKAAAEEEASPVVGQALGAGLGATAGLGAGLLGSKLYSKTPFAKRRAKQFHRRVIEAVGKREYLRSDPKTRKFQRQFNRAVLGGSRAIKGAGLGMGAGALSGLLVGHLASRGSKKSKR